MSLRFPPRGDWKSRATFAKPPAEAENQSPQGTSQPVARGFQPPGGPDARQILVTLGFSRTRDRRRSRIGRTATPTG